MTELRWTNEATFQDGRRNFQASGPGVYEVPDDAVEEYLAHRTDGWERVEDATDDSDETPNDSTESDAGLDEWWFADDGETFDIDEWLDKGYERRVEAVQSGAVDAHLDEIKDSDTSQNVVSAVEERQEE